MATVEKRGKSWRLVAYLNYDNNHKQKRKYKTISAEGITKAEAKRLANEFEADCLGKNFINDRNLTLSGFIEYWKEKYALQPDVYSPKTLERNEDLLARIIPALGHIRLNKLKPTHLLEFYDQLREKDMRLDGKKENDGRLSSRTVQMHHKLLSSILGKAKQWQFIELNPCQYVDAPKSKSKTMPIWDEENLIKFLYYLLREAKTKYQLFFLLAFTTGLRRGELVGLRWKDIDTKKMLLQVSQNAVVIKEKGIVYKDPKTEKSANGVSFPPEIMPIIDQHKDEQKAMENASKTPWPKSDLIFKTNAGNAMFPSTFSHWLEDFIEKHDLPKVSVHSFRHMSVTYAIDRGFDLKSISERARHAQLSTTTDIYAHRLPLKDRAIANSLGEIIEKAKEFRPDKKVEAPNENDEKKQ